MENGWTERIKELEDENKRLQKMNPCGHTGFESAPCDICGYPDPRKLIAKLKAENKRLAAEVFDKIVSGEMKITDMEDWEIITRTAFSEWLRGLETEAKARVYKAAVDQLADSIAAGAWQDGPAPKDGSWILGLFHGLPYVVGYDSWEVGGEMLPDGTGSPPDGHESGWCLAGDSLQVMDKDEPEKWARIIHPDRHMPASWDGPGDYR